MPSKLLVIPDSHANPRVSHRRYTWLGKFILDIKPDIILDLGDWGDNDSLSGYDKGKATFEGRRYAKDVEAAHLARDIVDSYIFKLQKRPRLVALCGNHEQRSDRYADEHPEMEGKISSQDFAPRHWEWYPFLKEVNIKGFICAHYMISGVQGRPISGEHPAYSLLMKQLRSCIVGHSHLYDYCERTAGTKRVQCIVAGAYTEPNWRPHYAGQARSLWHDGLVVLDGVDNGSADTVTQIGIKTLMKAYAR